MTDKPDLHVELQGDYIIITLPGTKFRVTYYKLNDPPELRAKSDWTDGNPRTGKTVSVRVNDRGPFTKGMTLDLSQGAARAIGMHSTQHVSMKRC
jgi:Lytic transglycolase